MRYSLLCIFVYLFYITGNVLGEEGGQAMKLTSSAFTHNQSIPQKYTCQGEDVSPPLTIEGAPAQTKSFAIIVDDPDAPMGTWVHWVVFNISPTEYIAEDTNPGMQGINDFGKEDYGGPCPPFGTHRYFFKLYALDDTLDLPPGIKKKQLEKAMEGHILAKAEMIGLYKKK
jgi:Raf kinase inhibitor-like YbhB/YbcL family protein